MDSIFLEAHNLKNRFGGLGTFNYELINALSKQDLQDLEITLNLQNINQIKKEFGKTFEYKKYYSLQRHSFFRVRKKIDTWHSLNQNIKIEPYNNPYKQYILTVHDVNFVEENFSAKKNKSVELFKGKIQRASTITYISEFAKKMTNQYFEIPNNVKEKVIYNGNPIKEFLDLSSFVPKITSKKPFLFSLGDFIPRKNFSSIIKMVKEINDFNLIISGNDNKSYGYEIKQLILNNNLSDKVFLTGKIDEKTKQYYLKNCEAFLFPSIREGFGLPPIEAMKFGKPVFLSNQTSLPEIGGDAAFYWDNFDPIYMKEILFDGLNKFENDKTYLIKSIERANFFSWDKAAKLYLELYKF